MNKNKKNRKEDQRIEFLNKYGSRFVKVNRKFYSIKYQIVDYDGFMVKGPIVEASENCPFNVGDDYEVSINELKYHLIISK